MLVGNIGTRRRLQLALEAESWVAAKERLVRMLNTPASEWPEPQIVDAAQAPCKEVIITGEDVDLETQAPKVWFGEEWSAMLSDTICATKHPETGLLNASCLLHSFIDQKPDGTLFDDALRKRHLMSYIFWNPHAGNHVGMNCAKQQTDDFLMIRMRSIHRD